MSERKPVVRALISVYDKTGLVDLAQGLNSAGVAIVSTGSTAKTIDEAGVPVTKVEDLTGFPECLDGRVKTLHPKIHAGILADRRLPDHVAQLAELGIEPFDLVVSNLYPFASTVASGASPDEVIEQIDIGGPSLTRAAAKNHPSVAIVVDPSDYEAVLAAVSSGGFTLAERQELAAKAFRHTAIYDIGVASWMGDVVAPDDDGTGFVGWVAWSGSKRTTLRYGENPHQGAALYVDDRETGGLARAEQLHGKEMSYNNYVDVDAAWRAAHDYVSPAVAVIKHANPCGIAVGQDIADAHAKAHACDPASAYGGVVAANGEFTAAAARQIADVFTEVVAAPSYEKEALEILSSKKNLRILIVEDNRAPVDFRAVSGGFLLMDADRVDAPGDVSEAWTVVAGDPVDEKTLADLEFAWRACRSVKSNAILLAKDGASVGIGMGQVNRVDSCRLAVARAGEERAKGSVAASDAFFPFPDGLEVLSEAGVVAVVQPGGSVRDEAVIEAATRAGIAMYITGTRHFFH
jgi:phosphoribosylaminoimidazolecarboxamide formyltransferase / IMP cyclohydrolase